ncbi:hypothetical protein D3C87_07670 [compost metagenome]
MIEKDNIQELFSKAFENQTSAVRPELWAGVQAKMAAAGVASTAAVATKGLSALTKWIIGSAAVGTVGVVTTVIALNSGEESINQKEKTTQKESVKVAATEDTSNEQTLQLNTPADSDKQKTAENKETNISNKEDQLKNDLLVYDMKLDEMLVPADKKIEPKSDDKKGAEPVTKAGTEDKKTNPAPAGSGISKTTSDNKVVENTKKYPENTNEPVFVDLETKVTHFPNAFTPNNDGQNDTYFVRVENIVDFRLIIFDDHNNLMFETNDPNEHWNGRNKAGEEAPEGMYAAVVTGKQQDKKSFRDIQMFQLIRR